MRIFKEGNWKNAKRLCPVCNTGKDGEVILIPIANTEEENIMEAVPVHLDCLQLLYDQELRIIYQKTPSFS